MLHVDDGQLHAYLDGELAATGVEPAELEKHLMACQECRRRMEEVRGTHARAVGILREAGPSDSIIPPFEGVVGRAALSPGRSVPHAKVDSTMSTATAHLGRPRFSTLPSSRRGGRRSWNSRTVTASLLIHTAMIIGVVYASVKAPEALKKEEELVEFMEIEEKAPEPEAPKPEEPPPPPPEQPEAPPPPKGFQTLMPPEEPPPAIPEVDISAPPVTAADFTGVGTAGGTSKGVEGGTPQAVAKEEPPAEGFAYEIAVLEKKPELANKSQVASLMQRLYPRMLQDAGIGGTVMMQFVIEADGKVEASSVKVIDSSHEQFGEASIKAVEKFRFRPGRYKGQNVRVLIQMPITWQPER